MRDWVKYIAENLKTEENMARKLRAQKAYLAYNNQHEALVREKVEDAFDNRYSKRPISTISYSKQITDAIATLYAADIKRTLNKKGKTNNKLEEYLNKTAWGQANSIFDYVNKLVFNQGTVIVQPAYSAKDAKIKYSVYPQFQFDLVYAKTTAVDKELEAVIISDVKGNVFWVYTANETIIVNIEEQSTEHTPHDLGILPFVVLHAKPVLNNSIYCMPEHNLAEQDILLNFAWSNVFNILTNQTGSTPLIIKPAEHADKDLEHNDTPGNYYSSINHLPLSMPINDTNKAMTLYSEPGETPPSFQYVSPNADFAGAIQVIKEQEKSLALSRGLPADFFNSNTFAQPATTSLLQNARIRGVVKNMEHSMVEFENDVFKLVKHILVKEATPPQALDAAEGVNVSFIPDSDFKDITVDEAIKLKEQQVFDNADILQRLEPFLSREEAQKRLDEKFQQNQELIE